MVLAQNASEFQFTHPGRGATRSALISDCVLLLFQFTHPGRGATYYILRNILGWSGGFNSRTPGGVRLSPRSISSVSLSFNSRTPGGVRLLLRVSLVKLQVFQFTHPGRGATANVATMAQSILVSIHAPREGCDVTGRIGRHQTHRVSIHAPREGCD